VCCRNRGPPWHLGQWPSATCGHQSLVPSLALSGCFQDRVLGVALHCHEGHEGHEGMKGGGVSHEEAGTRDWALARESLERPIKAGVRSPPVALANLDP
jgi:hypothetical protein